MTKKRLKKVYKPMAYISIGCFLIYVLLSQAMSVFSRTAEIDKLEKEVAIVKKEKDFYEVTVNGVGRAAFDEEVKHLIEDMPGKKLREYLDTEDNPRINISKIKSLLNTVNGLEAKGIIIPK